MTYATADDVEDEIDGFTTSASSPTVDEAALDRFIEEEEAAINIKLELMYVVPVDEGASPLSFAFLKRIETWMVAWRVVDILDNTSATVLEKGERVDKRMTRKKKQAEDEMLRIMAGTLVLSDAVGKASRISGNAVDC